MKVYFTASSSGTARDSVRDVKLILNLLKHAKHTNTNPYFKKVSLEEDGDLKVDIAAENVSEILLREIDSSDCVIAEISAPSVSLGIQIEYALGKKIPVLCLLREGKEDGGLPLLIRDYKSTLLNKQIYNPSNVGPIINEFIDNLPNSKVKFNMFIGYELDKYLSFLSKKTRKPKSELIRDLLTEKMNSDPTYK